MSSYASNQLVPKSVWVAGITSYAFNFSTTSSTNPTTACGFSYGLTLYASTATLTNGSQVFTDATLLVPFVGNAQYRHYLNNGGVSTVSRINTTGVLSLTTLC